MTREEQIDWLCRLKADLNNGIIFTPWNKEFIEALTSILDQKPCEDAISRREVLEIQAKYAEYIGATKFWQMRDDIKALPPVTPQPKTGHCKDCKWWRDSDGMFKRGVRAESKCPINRKEVLEGDGYCFMFKPRECEI